MTLLDRFKPKMPALRVEGAPDASLSRGQAFLVNKDLRPLEPERRTWTGKSFAAFWISDAVNLSSAVIVASSVQQGLAWYLVFIAVIVGYTIAAFGVVAMARPAATYHIGFPVIARSSFGVIFSVWPIINRVVTSTLWFAFQSALGGQCVTLVLRAMAPQYANMKNHLPESAQITSRDLLSFLLFWLSCIPFVLTKPEKIRYLFFAKSVLVPIGFIAFLGWSVHDAGGLGPIVKQKSSLSGKALGWAFVSAVTSQLSNMITLLTNSGDFARLARKRSDTVLPQLITMPVSFALTALVGLWIASSSTVIFQQSVFNPLDLLSLRLDRDPYSSSVRAGCWFLGAFFWLGQVGTNIAANSLSAGSDLTALLPRYISITRGGLLCAIVAVLVQPWRFATNSSSFATYLSAYSVLLAPFLGIMLADYYAVRRGHLRLASLYTLEKGSTYMYWRGINLRALLAYVAGLSFNLPGFIGAIKGEFVSEAAERIFQLAFFTGSISAALVYLAASHFFPQADAVPLGKKLWLEPKDGYETEESWAHYRPEAEAVGTSSSSDGGDDEKKDDGTGQTVQVQPYL